MKLSSDQATRYARHVLLDEVGARGQLRLLGTSVEVRGEGAAAEEAVRYLVAAGVGEIVVGADLRKLYSETWADLNPEVQIKSGGECRHRLELGSSDSRLEGAQAALKILVAVGVKGEA